MENNVHSGGTFIHAYNNNKSADTGSLPEALAKVTANAIESYIECDKAVFKSGVLKFKVKNDRLKYRVDKDTNTKFMGTGNEPLCSIHIRKNSK